MTIELRGGDKLQNITRNMMRELTRRSGSLYRIIGAELRDNTRRRMQSQDSGRWQPLGRWTVARTGKRRPLAGLANRVKYRLAGKSMQLYFDSPGNWSINDHHKGKAINPDYKLHTIPIKRPSQLGLPAKTTAFTFRWTRSKGIPARKIWPTAREAQDIVDRETGHWAGKQIADIIRNS